jgi:hypothetical protein
MFVLSGRPSFAPFARRSPFLFVVPLIRVELVLIFVLAVRVRCAWLRARVMLAKHFSALICCGFDR